MSEDEDTLAYALIVHMRIYDVLMGIYTHMDADGARDLAELHHKGVILGSAPNFTGEFVTETLNGVTETLNADASDR